MKKMASVLAAVVVLMTTPTLAADMVVKAPPLPPVPLFYDWSGPYVGLQGGGGFGSTTHTNQLFPTGTSGPDNNFRGGLLGGTYGYNWQFSHVVAGLEGDFSWSGLRDTFTSVNGLPTFCPAAFPCFTSLQWLGTDRARLGYAQDRFLIYATGGVAYGNVSATILNAGIFNIDSETHTRVGYTVGGGIEAMINRDWSVKLEYLYVDFGTSVGYRILPPPLAEPEDVSLKFNVVRLGIDYHFNGPVAAKY